MSIGNAELYLTPLDSTRILDPMMRFGVLLGVFGIFYRCWQVKLVEKSSFDSVLVGDVTGSNLKDERIIIGIRYDGHYIAQGAYDDAAGVCTVLDAARVLAKYRTHLKRIIRFIAFAVEEIGLHGSQAYIRQHCDELDKT